MQTLGILKNIWYVAPLSTKIIRKPESNRNIDEIARMAAI